jgi:hypothetical protein
MNNNDTLQLVGLFGGFSTELRPGRRKNFRAPAMNQEGQARNALQLNASNLI